MPLSFELPKEEMYGEPFGIPNPDEVVFMGWFAGGEVFPIYYDENVQQILKNAVKWAAPTLKLKSLDCIHAAVAPEQK